MEKITAKLYLKPPFGYSEITPRIYKTDLYYLKKFLKSMGDSVTDVIKKANYRAAVDKMTKRDVIACLFDNGFSWEKENEETSVPKVRDSHKKTRTKAIGQ